MSSIQTIIRKAETRDICRIYEFETQYIREMEAENMERWNRVERKTLEILRDSLEQTLILELDGIKAGHGRWEYSDTEACITSLFIRSCMRGRKWGGRLLEAMEEEIRSAGYKCITLSTLTHNPAQHLYERRGYKRVHVKKGWIYYKKELQLN